MSPQRRLETVPSAALERPSLAVTQGRRPGESPPPQERLVGGPQGPPTERSSAAVKRSKLAWPRYGNQRHVSGQTGSSTVGTVTNGHQRLTAHWPLPAATGSSPRVCRRGCKVAALTSDEEATSWPLASERPDEALSHAFPHAAEWARGPGPAARAVVPAPQDWCSGPRPRRGQ